ncbi:MAG: uracil-DNA glycosylase [Chloroflexota bacterium]
MGTVVLGEGPSKARVMLVGQNPGAEEAKQGRPFVGRAGKYLDVVLKKNGIDRHRIYITSIVKETTPHNRPPTSQEIERWMPELLEELKRIKPEIVVLMGKVAWQTSRLPGIEYIETYHPAAAMRFPGARARFEKDFKNLKNKSA